MKRTSLSLASVLALCAGITGTAHAQSNVTLYGLIDAGVEQLNNVSTGGSEDLGGGLKTVFTLESGFGSDNGTLQQGGRAFGR